jgi:L-serine deaminase
MIPAVDFLSCYAIAVNEVNASGGRIVTSPTNGAAGIIPAVLKYVLEFISDDPEKSVKTLLLTASVCNWFKRRLDANARLQAVGMLFKRGSTISAAEGGCQAEVGGTLIQFVIAKIGVHAAVISCMLHGQCWVCCLHGCIT